MRTTDSKLWFIFRTSLSDLMERQSKDPNLAQDFVAAILDNYEKMCSAAAHLAPALADLDQRHLQVVDRIV